MRRIVPIEYPEQSGVIIQISAANQEEMGFKWSFKPLVFIVKFAVGFPLNFIISKSKFPIRRLMVLFGGLAILLSNFLINGPRIINMANFNWMNVILKEDISPYVFFRAHPEMLLQFVVDVTAILFYIAFHLIPLTFLFTFLFTSKWNRLVLALHKIQNEMNPSGEMFRNCRRHCNIGLLVLTLVGTHVIIIKVNIIIKIKMC